MDQVSYDDAAPWPIEPDGSTGVSLEKLLPGLTNDAENWGPSLDFGGTPCAPNSAVSETKISASTQSPWTPAPGEMVKYEVRVSDPVNTVTSVNVTVSTNGFASNTTYQLADANSDGTWDTSVAASTTAGTTYTYAASAVNNLGDMVESWNPFMNFTVMEASPFISAFYSSASFQSSEFVVITYPLEATAALDISGWKLSDEALSANFFGTIGGFDSVWKFPASSSINPGESIFVAANGTEFKANFGMVADYEMNGTSTAANMEKVVGGGSTFEIYKGGDEILLVSPDAVIDIVAYSDFISTNFDGNGFLSFYSSVQSDAGFHRIRSDTDDPATDLAMESLPFIMVTNSVDGATYDGGETLELTMFDFGGIAASIYNWDGGTNTTKTGVTTSVTVPTSAGAHTLN
ncbi:MAG: hypothetical protein ACC656_11715, partial [Candidatus Heimdallarchaeota archaeon]